MRCIKTRLLGVIVALALGANQAHAQVTTMGNVATGTGNLSGGVTNQGGSPDFTTPPVDTLNINSLTQDIAPAAGTPGIEFLGPDITLNVDTGAFELMSDGAPAIDVGGTSGAVANAVLFSNSTVRTTGAAAQLLRFTTPTSSSNVISVTAQDTLFSTAGNNIRGIVITGAEENGISGLTFLNSTFETAGDDSAAFDIAGSRDTTVSTSTFSDGTITTQGDRSPGYRHGGLDASGPGLSINFIDFQRTSIGTTGADSGGLVIEGIVSDSSTGVYAVNDTLVTTGGNNSPGLVFGEQTGSAVKGSPLDSSSVTVSVDGGTEVTTLGTDSPGILIKGLGDGAVNADQDFSIDATVETSGDDSRGIDVELGDIAASSTSAFFADVDISTTGARSDGLVVTGVRGIANPGPADNRFEVAGSVSTTGVDARGIFYDGEGVATITVGTGEAVTSALSIGIEEAAGSGIETNLTVAGTLSGALTAASLGTGDDRFELQPGQSVSGIVDGGAGTDAFVLGGTGSDTFDHTLFGTQYINFESFTKEDSSTWTLVGPDSAVVMLPITVTGGTLAVDPVLSGLDVDVQAGAVLAGMGGVRTANIAGSFAPGDVGTAANFSVAGDLTMQPGSFFNVDILADGSSDLVEVDGTATVGGTLAVNGVMFPTGFPLENEYLVLTSPGAVLGSFDAVTDNLPDVDAMVMILAPTGPGDPDPNQPGRVVISYMRSTDTSDKAILSNSVQFGGQMGLAFVETMQRRARIYGPCHAGNQGFWQEGIGGGYQTNALGATGYSGGYGGYVVGVDRCLAAADGSLRYGLAAAYTGGGLTSGVSRADLDAGNVGLYASLNHASGLLLSTALGYSFLDYDIDRMIPVAGGGGPMGAYGGAGGGVLGFSLAGSFDLAPYCHLASATGMRFAPIVRFDWIDARRSGYSEGGMGVLDLDVSSADFESGLVSYGLEMGRRRVTAGGIPINALFDIRYEHLVGDRNATTTSVLSNVGGAPFADPGTLERQGRVAMGIGAEAQVRKNVSIHGRYDTALRGDSSSHRAAGGVTVRF